MANELNELENPENDGKISGSRQDPVVMLLYLVHRNGLDLPKCDNESYEDGFLDGINYFIQEMRVKIGAI